MINDLVTKTLKILFAGTPDFAAKHLHALLASQHQVVAAYTQPDRPAGRGKKLQASPVKTLAMAHNIPVHQPASLKSETALDELAAIDFDVMVVVAYGLILPKTVLSIPRLGCLNVHGSILPKWRGAAPIQRAIWAGDSKTGVTIMQMDEGLDTGDMLLLEELPIAASDTSASLYDKLADIGPVALVNALDDIEQLTPKPQNNDEATYAHKLDKSEGLLDWSIDGQQLARNIRAFNPWPGTWFTVGDTKVKVWNADFNQQNHEKAPGTVIAANKQGIEIAVGNGILTLKMLQIPGKKAQPVADILNSRSDWFIPGQSPGASH